MMSVGMINSIIRITGDPYIRNKLYYQLFSKSKGYQATQE